MTATRKSIQLGLKKVSKEYDSEVSDMGGESSDFFSVDPFPLNDNSISEITNTEGDDDVVGGIGAEMEVPQTPKLGGDKRKLMSKVGKALSFRLRTPKKPAGHIGEVNQEAIREKLALAELELLRPSTVEPATEQKTKETNPNKKKLKRSSSTPRVLPSSVKDISEELDVDTKNETTDTGKTKRRSRRSSSVGRPGTKTPGRRSSAGTRRRSASNTKYPESNDQKRERRDSDKSNGIEEKGKSRRSSGSNRGRESRSSAAKKSRRSKPKAAGSDSADNAERLGSLDQKSSSATTKEDRHNPKKKSRGQLQKAHSFKNRLDGTKTASRSSRKERIAGDNGAAGAVPSSANIKRALTDGKLQTDGKSNNSSRAARTGVRALASDITPVKTTVAAASRSSSRQERSLTILDLQNGGKITAGRPKLERSSSVKAALKSGGESLKNLVRSNTDTQRASRSSPRKERSAFEPIIDDDTDQEDVSHPTNEGKVSSSRSKAKRASSTGEDRITVRDRPGLHRTTSARNAMKGGTITARQRLQRAASVKGLLSSKNVLTEMAKEANKASMMMEEAETYEARGGPHRKQQKRASRLHRNSVVTSEVAHIQLQQLEKHHKKERKQQKGLSHQLSKEEELRKEAIKMLEEKYGGGNGTTEPTLKSRKSSNGSRRLTLKNIFHNDKEAAASATAAAAAAVVQKASSDLPIQIQGPILAAPPRPPKNDSESSSAVPSDHADLDDSIHRHGDTIMMTANTVPVALSA